LNKKEKKNLFEHLLHCFMTLNYLENVLKHADRAEGDAHAVSAVKERLDQVGARLEHVRPDVVQQVVQGVLAAETVDSERHVLDGRDRRLTVDQVPGFPSKATKQTRGIIKLTT
jgi:hypothetical protein